MPDCDYCGASYEDEQSYLRHLGAEHEGELGTIDQRRIEKEFGSGDDGTLLTGPLVLGLILIISVIVGGFVIFTNGSGGETTVNGIKVAQAPGPVLENAHEHGNINVTIEREQIDFAQPKYQRARQFSAFHFEGGNGRIWHKHANGVTLEYAMATLGIEVSKESVTIDGETYRDSDASTNVSITVDGEPVDPATYELQGSSTTNAENGDFIHVVATTDG